MPIVIASLIVVLALEDGGASLIARSVAAVLVWWAILSASAFSLVPRVRLPRIAVACAVLLVAFALFSALSSGWAPSAERAYDEMTRVLLYEGALLVPILFTRRGDAGRWADGLALALAVVGFLALGQRLFPDLLPADDLAQLPTAATRLIFPLGYWNGLGIFLGLGVPLLLRSAVAARAVAWRFAALLPLPVLAGAIYLTSSRGGAAVAVVAALTFVVLAPRRLHALLALVLAGAGSAGAIAVLAARPELVDGPFKSGNGGSAAVLILAIAAAAAAIYAALSTRVPARLRVPAVGWVGAALLVLAAIVAADPAERLRNFKAVPPDTGSTAAVAISSHLTSGGGSGRWQFWGAALDQFSAHPLAGGGAGSYEPYWAQHGSIDWFVRNAHSLWLETAGELGLIGVLLLVGVFALGLAGGVARLGIGSDGDGTTVAALVAVVVGFALGGALDWVWQLPVVPVVALACLGLLVGPATWTAAGEEPTRMRFGARAALVLGAWLAVIAAAIPFLGSEEIGASQRALRRGDVAAAVERAKSARAIEPWASSPRLQLALAYEQGGRIDLARRQLAGAIERDDADWRLRLIDSRLAVKAGDVPAARRALARARALNPRSRLLRSLTSKK